MTVPKLLIGVVALSVVVAFVPAALGAERPDDRADRVGAGSAPVGVVAAVVRPDDRADRVGAGAATPIAVETPSASNRIDWGDPLVVAGLTALVAAAGVAIAYGVVHHRHGGAGTTGGPGRPAVTH